jgi:predicted RNA-binding Zn-ribbon protein involved in translation (DUF1610 family)
VVAIRHAEQRHCMAIDIPPAESGIGHRCPSCGAAVERVHRHAIDRALSVLRSMHRYRCVAPACGWEGLLRRFSVDTEPDRSAQWRSRLLWLLVGAAIAVAGMQGLRRLQARAPTAHPTQLPTGGAELQSRATPAGQDFAGEAVPAEDHRMQNNRTPLTLRNSCAWGVPGANRYRGSVDQALRAAQLPGEVVRQITEKVERGWMHEQVEISRDGIRTLDGRRDYGKQMLAMAFGNTLCFNTRVNFVPGHVEVAALYRAADSQGRHYTVIVPYVCDNVAVLGERAESEGNGHRVPEPATAAMALLGLALAAGLKRRAARRSQP